MSLTILVISTGLRVPLVWWSVEITLVVGDFVHLFRSTPRKVSEDAGHPADDEGERR